MAGKWALTAALIELERAYGEDAGALAYFNAHLREPDPQPPPGAAIVQGEVIADGGE